MVSVAKIMAEGQIAIPQDICLALHVNAGDLITWEMESDGSARVRRIPPVDTEYFHAIECTLSEWSGPEDEAAYRDL